MVRLYRPSNRFFLTQRPFRLHVHHLLDLIENIIGIHQIVFHLCRVVQIFSSCVHHEQHLFRF